MENDLPKYIVFFAYNYREAYYGNSLREVLKDIYLKNIIQDTSKLSLANFLREYNSTYNTKYKSIDDLFEGEWMELLDEDNRENFVQKIELDNNVVYARS